MALFGPLKVSSQGKKFVLCLTDAFTKYAVMLAIDNKEAATVAKAIFEQWVCKFGTPLEFVSDNGREFCNNLAKELYALLKIKHSTTTPYWPQCNSQAEVANKTIQKYLASFVDETTLDWPLYMAPMAFAYNTSVHRSIKTTPFFLTFGVEPRYPSFPNPEVQRYYGESTAAEWYNTLQHCRQLAARQNMDATDQAEQHYNRTAQQHTFTQGQMVWLNETNYLGRNRKLAPQWTGPHLILRTLDNGVVELLIKNRRVRVNVGRLKPVTPALPQTQPQATQSTPNTQSQQPATPPPQPACPPPLQLAPPQDQDDALARAAIIPALAQAQPPQPEQPCQPAQPPPRPEEPPPIVKRGRGRPRKVPTAAPPPPAPAPLPEAPQPAQPEVPTAPPAGPLTRARARALERQNLPASDAIQLIRKVNATAKQAAPFKSIPIYGVAEGPTFVADEYGLPKEFKNQPQPKSITQRRKYLKSLSPTQRNLLLTGDPVFAFDPLAYEVAFRGQLLPPLLLEQFDYLLPQQQHQQPDNQPQPQPPQQPQPLQPQPPQQPTPPRAASLPHVRHRRCGRGCSSAARAQRARGGRTPRRTRARARRHLCVGPTRSRT